MALMERLQTELIAAMKAGEGIRVETIRMLLTALKNATIDAPNHLLTEADEIVIVSREAKKRSESIEIFNKGGRSDLAEHEKQQLDVLKVYLPVQANDGEIEDVIKEVINDLGSQANFGSVMKASMTKLAGRADGNKVSSMVKLILET